MGQYFEMTMFLFVFTVLLIFREDGRVRERNISQLLPAQPPLGDQACNPGMRPDLNLTSNPSVRRTTPHLPGKTMFLVGERRRSVWLSSDEGSG